MLRQFVAIPKISLFFLQPARIGQKYLEEICRSPRTKNRFVKALFYQAWQVARVIDVSMRDDYCIKRSRIKWRVLPVPVAQFSQPLKYSAINENTGAVGLDQILGTGDCANAAPE
jgi:hypothetical protein